MKLNSLRFAATTLFLASTISLPALAVQTQTIAPAASVQAPAQWMVAPPQPGSISPSIGLRNGKGFSVLVKVADCDPTNKDPNKPHAPAKLSPLGNGLAFTDVKPDQTCTLLATLTIDPLAFPGPTPILIQDSAGKTIDSVNFNIADAPPGPIPPGLEPQVDVMWAALPEKVVKDAFGSWIWKKYHSVEVVIGNNSGYDLQLASIGFQLRNFNHGFTPLDSDFAQAEKLPTNDYHIVRSTIEKQQTHGARAIVLSSLQAASLLAAGGIPYFHNPGPKANYSTAIAIAGDPVVKAYNLIFPDHTIAELSHLDNLALHDSTIIPNNNQTRTVVFVPRDTLKGYFQQSGSGNTRNGFPCADSKKTKTLLMISGEVTTRHCNDKNPLDVKYWLGNLILIGDQIQYRNRIQVKTVQNEPQVAPLKLTPTDFVIEDLGTKPANVTLTGASLEKLPDSISPIAGGTLKLDLQAAGNAAISRNGTVSPAAGTTLKPGSYVVDFPYVNGKTSIAINVRHRHLCNVVDPPVNVSGKTAEIKLKIEGAGDTTCSSDLFPVSGNLATSNGVAFDVQKCSNDPGSTCINITAAASASIDNTTTVDFSTKIGDPGRLVFAALKNAIKLQ